jgi:hypothetical protein
VKWQDALTLTIRRPAAHCREGRCLVGLFREGQSRVEHFQIRPCPEGRCLVAHCRAVHCREGRFQAGRYLVRNSQAKDRNIPHISMMSV